jgi:hypothetical protein
VTSVRSRFTHPLRTELVNTNLDRCKKPGCEHGLLVDEHTNKYEEKIELCHCRKQIAQHQTYRAHIIIDFRAEHDDLQKSYHVLQARDVESERTIQDLRRQLEEARNGNIFGR